MLIKIQNLPHNFYSNGNTKPYAIFIRFNYREIKLKKIPYFIVLRAIFKRCALILITYMWRNKEYLEGNHFSHSYNMRNVNFILDKHNLKKYKFNPRCKALKLFYGLPNPIKTEFNTKKYVKIITKFLMAREILTI